MGFFEAIGNFFASLPSELYVFLISILPIIELRGAIPVGAALGVEFYTNYLLSVLGNMLPIPFILLFIPKILAFLERFKAFRPIVRWLKEKADKHSSKVLGEQPAEPQGSEVAEAATENAAKAPVEGIGTAKMSWKIFSALMLFVAIPLPGTGAWTGSLVAALFYLPKKQSLLAIFLGVLISGVIMTLASYGVLGFLSFLL